MTKRHPSFTPVDYDKLTRTQRSTIILAAVIAVFLQSISCYVGGVWIHNNWSH